MAAFRRGPLAGRRGERGGVSAAPGGAARVQRLGGTSTRHGAGGAPVRADARLAGVRRNFGLCPRLPVAQGTHRERRRPGVGAGAGLPREGCRGRTERAPQAVARARGCARPDGRNGGGPIREVAADCSGFGYSPGRERPKRPPFRLRVPRTGGLPPVSCRSRVATGTVAFGCFRGSGGQTAMVNWPAWVFLTSSTRPVWVSGCRARRAHRCASRSTWRHSAPAAAAGLGRRGRSRPAAAALPASGRRACGPAASGSPGSCSPASSSCCRRPWCRSG